MAMTRKVIRTHYLQRALGWWKRAIILLMKKDSELCTDAGIFLLILQRDLPLQR